MNSIVVQSAVGFLWGAVWPVVFSRTLSLRLRYAVSVLGCILVAAASVAWILEDEPSVSPVATALPGVGFLASALLVRTLRPRR